MEHKLLCPMHSEAQQTKISEFGAEKGLLQGHARIDGLDFRWPQPEPVAAWSRVSVPREVLSSDWGSESAES